MAGNEQLYAALRNADAAGDVEGARKLAAYIQTLPEEGAAAPAAPADTRGFGQKLNDEISNVPRQLGLTARYGVEAVGDTLDALSAPIRWGMNAVLPKRQSLSGLVTGEAPRDAIPSGTGRFVADLLHLPQPATPRERVVGDATKTMASVALPFGAASKMTQAAPLVNQLAVQDATKSAAANALSRAGSSAADVGQGIVKSLSMNPASQVLSAGSAGAAGGYTKETGGNDTAQLVASLAAGVAAPAAISGGKNLIAGTKNVADRLFAKPAALNAQIDITIDNALRSSGMTLGDFPANMQASIRQDVQNALSTNGALSPDAVRRLADYRLTNTTPTAATLTLDPAMVSQQKNLAKLGINSKDATAQQLGRTENANNAQLITSLNDLGANRAVGKYGAGERMLDSLNSYAAGKRQEITNLYNAAKDAQGRSLPLDPQTFSNGANNLLDHNLKGAFVPEQIRTMMNDFATGKVPLNIHSAEQFKTIIANAQRGATDGNVKAALGHIREALDNTPLVGQAGVAGGTQVALPGTNIGQDAIDAFNAARAANRAHMTHIESNPALAAAIDGAAPDAFFAKHVVNGEARNLEAMLPIVGKGGIKADLIAHLKDKALSGAADEVGNFSQSAFNKALSAIGDQKLAMILEPAELKQLKAIGRVASYEQFQPKGSAVNNSNTAGSAIATILDRIGNSALLSKIPLGAQLAQPAQNIAIGIKSRNAMNVPNALAGAPLPSVSPPNALMLSPAALISHDDERNSLASRR